MFNESRIGISKNGTNNGKDIFDHVVIVDADITAAIGCGLKGGSLNIGREEVEEIEECCQSAFTNNRARIFFGYFFERLDMT